MFDTCRAYDALKRTYYTHMATEGDRAIYCPPKTVEVIKRNDAGVITHCANVMQAKDKQGNAVYKRIVVDDEAGKTTEDVSYFSKRSGVATYLTDAGITPIRCGLMTCLAIERLAKEKPRTVGYIGNGRINMENCASIKSLFGSHRAVIRGSRRNRGYNRGVFENLCKTAKIDDSDDMRFLNECDVVISCTSTCNREDVIENDLLKDVPLVIALDSGYLFGESFRKERVLYTDHVEQLSQHYADEFPYDSTEHPHFNLTDEVSNGKLAVNLFGVAIADLVVAKHYVGEGIE